MRFSAVGVVAVGLALSASCAVAGTSPERWARTNVPASGPVTVLGGPAAGCISGAVALPSDGEGYQTLRLGRNRFWGHPRTIAFVQGLGASAARDGLGTILVGDLSQPRGGPMSFGHGSHQTGLDVDIWFRIVSDRLSDEERERPVGISMVKGQSIDGEAFTPSHLRLLQLAASSPEVDRIFVNPAIKAAACRSTEGDRTWLGKLRPWWGHDEHFHVRLSCPVGDPGCVPQKPVPDGDGCGPELASWSARPTLITATDLPNHRRPVLPAACDGVLKSGGVIQASTRRR
ncbi:MAG: penicillin-insensitive murein endopeptidase [Solirubrobacterales bacterium]